MIFGRSQAFYLLPTVPYLVGDKDIGTPPRPNIRLRACCAIGRASLRTPETRPKARPKTLPITRLI